MHNHGNYWITVYKPLRWEFLGLCRSESQSEACIKQKIVCLELGEIHTQLPSIQTQLPPAKCLNTRLLQTNLPAKIQNEGCQRLHELYWMLHSSETCPDGARFSSSVHYKIKSLSLFITWIFKWNFFYRNSLGSNKHRMKYSAFWSIKKCGWITSLGVTERTITF